MIKLATDKSHYGQPVNRLTSAMFAFRLAIILWTSIMAARGCVTITCLFSCDQGLVCEENTEREGLWRFAVLSEELTFHLQQLQRQTEQELSNIHTQWVSDMLSCCILVLYTRGNTEPSLLCVGLLYFQCLAQGHFSTFMMPITNKYNYYTNTFCSKNTLLKQLVILLLLTLLCIFWVLSISL